jgi:hypothetical protein
VPSPRAAARALPSPDHRSPTSGIELPVLGIAAANVGATGIRSAFAVTQLMPGAYWNPDNSIRVNGLEGNSGALCVEGRDATNTVTLA